MERVSFTQILLLRAQLVLLMNRGNLLEYRETQKSVAYKSIKGRWVWGSTNWSKFVLKCCIPERAYNV